MLASSSVIITFIKFKESRKSPGDFIFILSICEFLLALHWFMMGIFNISHDRAALSHSSFC